MNTQGMRTTKYIHYFASPTVCAPKEITRRLKYSMFAQPRMDQALGASDYSILVPLQGLKHDRKLHSYT